MAVLVQLLVVLQLIILLLQTLNDLAAAVSLTPRQAKLGCDEKCGNVTIPYPFGMGKSSCYLDEWFEIECNTSRRPFLKKAKLEVLEIQLPEPTNTFEGGMIHVNSPIITFNCKGAEEGSSLAVDLRGSNFHYSDTLDKFVAAGCNYHAEMAHTEPLLIGCNPSCTPAAANSTSNDRCNSAPENCRCGNNVPTILKVFNVIFHSIAAAGADDCGYAFIVGYKYMDRTFPSYNSGYFPASLEWGIHNDSLEAAERLRNQENDPSFYCTTPYEETSLLQCYCKSGFQGNPYLPNGCQDINECELPEYKKCADTCENIPGSYRCRYSRLKLLLISLGSSVGLLILIIGVWWLYKMIERRNQIIRKKRLFKQNGGLLLEQHINSGQGNVETTKVFSSKELEVATDHFNMNRILGQGGQGTVYKGMLPDGTIVAVKKSKFGNEGKFVEQFINEVVILSQINHRHVVKLLGCCLETEVPLLVYEFVPNGTLFQYLHSQSEEFTISWEMRLEFATEVAGALSYLHSAASMPIYHRDIKSTNILLDDKYKTKVADFGTSRSVAIDQTHLTTLVHGTFGYLDPEYYHSSQFTDKSDVYSFGVVLVELLTGQKPVCCMRPEEYRSLVTYFLVAMEENFLFNILDAPVLKEGDKNDEIVGIANLARRCLHSHGRNRPTMREVTIELERIRGRSNAQHSNYQEIDHLLQQQQPPRNADVTSSFTEYGVDSSYVALSIAVEP